jgi:hypothetical protein
MPQGVASPPRSNLSPLMNCFDHLHMKYVMVTLSCCLSHTRKRGKERKFHKTWDVSMRWCDDRRAFFSVSTRLLTL